MKENNDKNYEPEEDNPEDVGKDLITLEANLIEGENPPMQIKVTREVYKQLKEILAKKNLTPKKVALGVVAFNVAVGTGYVLKKRADRKRDQNLQLSDEKLEKFENVFENYSEDIFNYISYLVGDQEVAQDLTQEVFIRALKRYHKFTPKEGLASPERSWLFTIARNTSYSYFRDKGQEGKNIAFSFNQEDWLEETFPDDDQLDIASLIDNKSRAELLSKALLSLPDDRKQIIYLKLAAGLPNKEVGHILGKTEGAIKSLYVRTLQEIKAFCLREQIKRDILEE